MRRSKITSEHIRHASNAQLARLLGVTSSCISNWLHGRPMVETSLKRAINRGISPAVLLEGIEAKRRDIMTAKAFQAELEEMILSTPAGAEELEGDRQSA